MVPCVARSVQAGNGSPCFLEETTGSRTWADAGKPGRDPLQVRDEGCLVQEDGREEGTLADGYSGRRMGLEWSGHEEEGGCIPRCWLEQ